MSTTAPEEGMTISLGHQVARKLEVLMGAYAGLSRHGTGVVAVRIGIAAMEADPRSAVPFLPPLARCVGHRVLSEPEGDIEVEVEEIDGAPAAAPTDPLSRHVESLNVAHRVTIALHAEGIETVGDIMRYTPTDFLARKNFGQKSLQSLRDALSLAGICWPADGSDTGPTGAGR